MKNIVYLLLVVLTFSSCKKQEPRTDFIIEGTAKNIYNGVRIYLNETDPRGRLKPIDTAIVMNEKFTLNGKVEIPSLYYLTINSVNGRLPLLIENSAMTLNVDKKILQNSELIGSESHTIWSEYNTKIDDFKTKGMKLSEAASQARFLKDTVTAKSNTTKLNRLNEDLQKYPLEFVNRHSDNFAVLQILNTQLRNPNADLEAIYSSYQNLSDSIKSSSPGKVLEERMKVLKERKEKEKLTAIGAIAPNFTAANPKGEMVSLKDIKGKVTIIDFWAAWCGPCRRENPNVVKVYNKYHDKGLEIIGVSLDGRRGQQNPKKEWLDAIEKDKLDWHQVSNLKYFGPIAQQYNVGSIPAMFVLDAEGKIIAKNLRGIALENKMAELFSK